MDGDTFWTCSGDKVRLVAASGPMDAPEMPGSPRCQHCDPAAGVAARERLKAIVQGARSRQMACDGTDKYGRRLCRVSVDGHDLGDWLISEGHAVLRPDWAR